MKRRQFIGALGTALAATCSPQPFTAASGKLHIITLSFDDGFRKSFLRTAEIYEKFGLSACFNIVAAAHLPDTVVLDDYMPREQFGDFGVWNKLQDRGHESHDSWLPACPLARLPFEKAKELILKSLDLFSKELRGFDPKKAVFNFPYNESTPELEDWLPLVVMAFRARGGMLNPSGAQYPQDHHGRLGARQCGETCRRNHGETTGATGRLDGLQPPRYGRRRLGTDTAHLSGKALGKASADRVCANHPDRPGLDAGQGWKFRQPLNASRKEEGSLSQERDAVIVGAGASGRVVAHELAHAGLRVALLERGRS